MSQIRCVDNTYQKPFPNVVRARHTKLQVGGGGAGHNSKSHRMSKGYHSMKTEESAINEAKLNRDVPKNEDLFKPRRAITKSFDFTNLSLQKTLDSVASSGIDDPINYSPVGSRYSMNNTQTL